MMSITSGDDIDQFALDFDSDEACIGIDSYDVVDFHCDCTLNDLFEPKPVPINTTMFDESSDEDDSVEVVSAVFVI